MSDQDVIIISDTDSDSDQHLPDSSTVGRQAKKSASTSEGSVSSSKRSVSTGSYSLPCRMTRSIEYIKEQVGDRKVLVLLSGGVDSTVCAALLRKALAPKQIYAVHIDNGFMRENESQEVIQSLEALDITVHLENASMLFSQARTVLDNGAKTPNLMSTVDPEIKRRIIGDTFLAVADQVMTKLNLDSDNVLLCQGTLRPDLIESASHLATKGGLASVIKTHHNDTALVRKRRDAGMIIEPLKDFHKDEVRAIGRSLGLSDQLTDRHPFPGPGLAIRVICANQRHIDTDFGETEVLAKLVVQYKNLLAMKHALLNRIENNTSEADRELLIEATSIKYNATLLPIRTVGVQGDARSYNYCVGISCAQEPNWEHLKLFSRIIPQVCHSVNRVVFIFGPLVQHPVNEVTPTQLSPSVVSTIRQADNLATQVLASAELTKTISQMPVVLVPVHLDRDPRKTEPSCARAVAVRPFITDDFMTGEPALPGKHIPLEVVQNMVSALLAVNGISRVFYDITTKPPGTTEWE